MQTLSAARSIRKKQSPQPAAAQQKTTSKSSFTNNCGLIFAKLANITKSISEAIEITYDENRNHSQQEAFQWEHDGLAPM